MESKPQDYSRRRQLIGTATDARVKAMGFSKNRINMTLTNLDTVEVLGYGGNGVTFATCFPLVPGTPVGGVMVFEGKEAQAELWVIADAGKNVNYHISWIQEKEYRR